MAVHAFKYGDYIKNGANLVKANLVASIVAMLGACIPFAGFCVIVNYMRALKEAKNGKPIEIGALFQFGELVPALIAGFITVLTSGPCCCFVGWLLQFSLPILADKPGTDPMNAVKASFNFGKQNLVGMVILIIACSMVVALPMIVLGIVGAILQMILNAISSTLAMIVGILFGLFTLAVAIVLGSIPLASIWHAYDDARAAVEASAAEAGVKI